MNGKFLIVFAIVAWGLWGVCSKASQLRIYPAQVSIIVASTSAVTIPIYMHMLWAANRMFVWDTKGIAFAFAAGLLGAGANLAYTFALRELSVGTVVGLTSSYPALTFLLSIILFNETVTMNKIIGLVLILGGVFFLGKS